jgi:endogenous inhibitor of DNA gyrase (YacG/DUF329 family)
VGVVQMKCVVCGKEFESKNSNRKYCSKKCTNTQYYILKKQGMPARELTCPYCGKIFTTTRDNKIFCSETCGKRAWAKQKRDEDRKNRPIKPKMSKVRNADGLTEQEVREVIYAQDYAAERLYELSKSWTDKQRNFAKKRYCQKHEVYTIKEMGV